MRRFPDFGRELRRPFAVHENCYDCAGFYDGCDAWPESRPFDSTDCYLLPDVMPGGHGQVFPPSRMRGRKQPQAREGPEQGQSEASPVSSTAVGPLPRRPPGQTRRRSPVANRGLSGERLCECGATLRKRKRCCDACRLKRREETMRQRRSRRWPSTAVDAASGLPFTGRARPSTQARSGAHNYLGLRYPEQTSV